jgi:hypothetical protein
VTPILAHFGHWYVQLLYAAPVAVIVGILGFQSWRTRREAARSPPPRPSRPPPRRRD